VLGPALREFLTIRQRPDDNTRLLCEFSDRLWAKLGRAVPIIEAGESDRHRLLGEWVFSTA
jgi:hypothetical protein